MIRKDAEPVGATRRTGDFAVNGLEAVRAMVWRLNESTWIKKDLPVPAGSRAVDIE